VINGESVLNEVNLNKKVIPKIKKCIAKLNKKFRDIQNETNYIAKTFVKNSITYVDTELELVEPTIDA